MRSVSRLGRGRGAIVRTALMTRSRMGTICNTKWIFWSLHPRPASAICMSGPSVMHMVVPQTETYRISRVGVYAVKQGVCCTGLEGMSGT